MLYWGDGNPTQAVTGVGFRPRYVKVWTRYILDSADQIIWERTDQDSANMSAQHYKIAAQSGHRHVANVGIISLDSDGFTVGGEINGAGTLYVAICWG